MENITNATHYIDGNGYITERRRRRMFSKISLKQTNKKSPLTLQRCEECGSEKMAKGRTWCDWNPTAPFMMRPINLVQIADKAMSEHLAK